MSRSTGWKADQGRVDFTAGSILVQIIRFSIPILIGNLFQQMYTIVDSILLGRLVSPQALAAAGNVTPVTVLMLSVISGFTLGTSLVTAALTGAGQQKEVRRLIESTFLCNMMIGIALAFLAFSGASWLLGLMHTPPEVKGLSMRYLRIICVGIVFQCLGQYLTDVLRGMGDSRTPLFFLLMSTGLNIVLDILFTAGFRLGVDGVAWATVIAQACAALACLVYSRRRYDCFSLNVRPSGIDRSLLMRSLRLGLPSAVQQMVGSLGAICMQTVVNGFGAAAMNAYSSAYKVDNFIMLPVSNMGAALGTCVAQNVGAGRYDRARQGFWKVSALCAVLSVALSALIFCFAESLAGIFVTREQTEIIRLGARGLRILAVPYVLCSQLALYMSFFKGAGAVRAALAGSLSQVAVRLLICTVLAPVIGLDAVWFAMPATWVLIGGISFVYDRKTDWEQRWKSGLKV